MAYPYQKEPLKNFRSIFQTNFPKETIISWPIPIPKIRIITSFAWIKSYVSEGHRYVTVGDRSFEVLKITCGVPQGSTLAPLLFILYQYLAFDFFHQKEASSRLFVYFELSSLRFPLQLYCKFEKFEIDCFIVAEVKLN